MGKSSLRLAFMLASIHSGSSTLVWPEVAKECRRRGATLLVFPGGRLESKEEYEYMRNRIFGFVRPDIADGVLCWASSLSGFVPERRVQETLASISLPLVTFGLKIGDNPAVTMDAYQGMKSLLIHMVRHHGRRRIAFIAGPKAHSSAEERYKAYRDILRETGLRFDPSLVVLDTPWTEGRTAILELLDRRGKKPKEDFDALCAASDLLAFDAATLLQERGYRLPADLALGGFNDSAESNMVSPTYTTVRMPFERQATKALQMLLDRLKGKSQGDSVLKTSLVVRQSCGCLPSSVRLAGRRGSKRWRMIRKDPRRPQAEEVLRFLQGLCHFSPSQRKAYIQPLAQAWLDCLAGGAGERSRFQTVLEDILDGLVFQERELGNLQDAVSGLRIVALETLKGEAGTVHAQQEMETLAAQARVLVSEGEKRRSNYRVWKERQSEQWMNLLAHALLCVRNLKDILEVAGRYFPSLGVSMAHVVVEEAATGKRRYAGGFFPDYGNPVQGGQSSPFFLPEEEEILGPGEFLPFKLLPLDPGSYVVEPLYTESRFLGYAVLGMGGAEAWVYEELRAQLSSALRGVALFEQANQARQRAEAAERLKSEFLANLTGELQDPVKEIEAVARACSAVPGAFRGEMERIVALAERHRTLTSRLLDLSLSQVGAFGLDLKLEDPRRLAAELAEAMSGVKFQDSGGPLPLACLDKGRILLALELLCKALSSRSGGGRLALSPGWDASGLALRLSAPTPRPSEAPASGIDLELAKRIFLLHGGEISEFQEPGASGFIASLPFPSPKGFAARIRPRDETPAVGLLTRADSLGSLPRKETWIDIESAAQEATAGVEGFDFAFLDPRALGWNECEIARAFMSNPSRARSSLFIPAETLPAGQTFRSIASFLDYLSMGLGGAYVVYAGPAGESAVSRALLERGSSGTLRAAVCASREGMEILARRERPALVVVESRDPELIRAACLSPVLRECPLAILSPVIGDQGLIAVLADRPKALVCNSGPAFDAKAMELLESMALGREYLPAVAGHAVAKAIVYLNSHFKEPVSRWKLSSHVAASEDYLSRIFKKQMGMSLWEYLNRLRAGKAAGLLAGSSESVAEIADLSGFRDQAYFCRVFKRILGKSPRAFRKDLDNDVRIVQKPD